MNANHMPSISVDQYWMQSFVISSEMQRSRIEQKSDHIHLISNPFGTILSRAFSRIYISMSSYLSAGLPRPYVHPFPEIIHARV